MYNKGKIVLCDSQMPVEVFMGRAVSLSKRVAALKEHTLFLAEKHVSNYLLCFLAGVLSGKRIVLLDNQIIPKQICRLFTGKEALLTLEPQTALQWADNYPIYSFPKPMNTEGCYSPHILLNSEALLLFKTSGTTSDKVRFSEVPISWLLYKSQNLSPLISLSSTDTGIVFSSMCFIQVVWTILMLLISGSSIVVTDYEIKHIARLCEKHEVNTMVTTPSVIRGFLMSKEGFPGTISKLMTGGDLMDSLTLTALKRQHPNITYVCVYGCTETSAANIITPPLLLSDYDEKTETIGFPAKDNEVRLLPKSGEICIRTPYTPGKYCGAQTSFLDSEGFFHTGDVGKLKEDGQIIFLSRLKNIIICNGRKFTAHEVEAALNQLNIVSESIVLPCAHAIYGQIAVAVVVLRAPSSERTIAKKLLQYLEPYKIPKKIVFVDELPKTASGKTKRGAHYYEHYFEAE